jgi:hypothetical protein
VGGGIQEEQPIDVKQEYTRFGKSKEVYKAKSKDWYMEPTLKQMNKQKTDVKMIGNYRRIFDEKALKSCSYFKNIRKSGGIAHQD